jgi:hypothetical protein
MSRPASGNLKAASKAIVSTEFVSTGRWVSDCLNCARCSLQNASVTS